MAHVASGPARRRRTYALFESPSTSPLIVLDTNVVLDWTVFGNPEVGVLVDAILGRRIQWVACRAMLEEFDVVLARGFRGRSAEPRRCQDVWERHCRLVDPTPGGGATMPPRCRDPSDQMFVDLALQVGARWIVSRDRALLALGKRMAALGTRVTVPERWTA